VLSDDELARLRALCDAATPGPWTVGSMLVDGVQWGTVDGVVRGERDLVALINRGPADANAIAAMGTALPALLDAHARMRAALATIAAGMATTDGECCWCGTLGEGADPHQSWCPTAIARAALAALEVTT